MHLLSELGAKLLGIGEGTLNFFISALKALASNPQVQQIAMEEVQKAEDAAVAAVASGNAMTGVQKFSAAQTGVVAQLTAVGLPVVTNQINLAIEGAVANLQANKGS
jgi:hypothetical protein